MELRDSIPAEPWTLRNFVPWAYAGLRNDVPQSRTSRCSGITHTSFYAVVRSPTASNAVVRSPRCRAAAAIECRGKKTDAVYEVRCSDMECRGAATKSAAAPRHSMPSYEVRRQRSCRGAATKSALQSSSGIECRRAATKSDGSGAAVVQQRSPRCRAAAAWNAVVGHPKF
jgi:hypothetical protein